MSSAISAKLISAAAILLLLGHGALAQSVGLPHRSGKLGSPVLATVSVAPLPDPGSLFNYSGYIGQTIRFNVVGATRGGIWGDGIYTSDSVLAVAAVHAGLLRPGEAGIVTVTIVRGLPAYQGVARNGVTSLAYGAWDVAFELASVEYGAGGAALADPGDLSAHRGQNGLILKFEVTGADTGSLWGSSVYTDDSTLALAAVHAGVLSIGQTGIVTVEILPGQSSYPAAEANGIVSTAYGAWQGSYRVLSPMESKSTTKLSN